MDFCPSESLGGAEKYPESPFTAAGCVLLAHPDKEQEIYAEIRRRLKKTKKARLRAMSFLREKIENDEIRVHALCIQRTEGDLFFEGAVNCMSKSTMDLLVGLPIAYNAAKAGVIKVAEELGISEHTTISTTATLTMSHGCAIHFLEIFQKSGLFKGGEIRVTLDTPPGISKRKLEQFQAISARFLKLPHESYLKNYGATVVYKPLGNDEEKPCGLLIADLLAHVSIAVTDNIRSPGDYSPPAKRSPQLPEYSDEELDEIRGFLNFMLKGRHLLMATPEMLMAMVNVGEKIKSRVFKGQAEHGLDVFNPDNPDYMSPYEFLTPEAKGRKE